MHRLYMCKNEFDLLSIIILRNNPEFDIIYERDKTRVIMSNTGKEVATYHLDSKRLEYHTVLFAGTNL